jgi:hypothetical protein
LGTLTRKQKRNRLHAYCPSRGGECGGANGRLGLFHFDHVAAHIPTTGRTDHVRRQPGAALRAKRQLAGLLEVMRTTRASARIRMFALRYSHLTTSARNLRPVHNLFCDNLFGIDDKPHMVEVVRLPVKRSERPLGPTFGVGPAGPIQPCALTGPGWPAFWTATGTTNTSGSEFAASYFSFSP